jgi:hypothetical protein
MMQYYFVKIRISFQSCASNVLTEIDLLTNKKEHNSVI